MDKINEINRLLISISEQVEELLSSQETENMTAEEIIVLATEIAISEQTIDSQYAMPVGEVDRSRVSFMLDEGFELPLFEEEYDE